MSDFFSEDDFTDKNLGQIIFRFFGHIKENLMKEGEEI